METEVRFLVQSWNRLAMEWTNESVLLNDIDAKSSVAFRKLMDGHDGREYRIVRATTTYEAIEETK